MANLLFLGIVWPYLFVVATKLGLALLFTHVMPPEVQHPAIHAMLTDPEIMYNLARTSIFMALAYIALGATLSTTTTSAARRLGDILVWSGTGPRPSQHKPPRERGPAHRGGPSGETTRLMGARARAPQTDRTDSSSDSEDCIEHNAGDATPSAHYLPQGIWGGLHVAWAWVWWPLVVCLRLVLSLARGVFNDSRPAVVTLESITLGSAHQTMFAELAGCVTAVGSHKSRVDAVNATLDRYREGVAASHAGLLPTWDAAATDLRAAILSPVAVVADAIAVELYTITFLYAPLYFANIHGAWGILPVLIMAHVLYIPLVGARVLASGFLYLNTDAVATALLDTDGVVAVTDTLVGAAALAMGVRYRGLLVVLRALVPCSGMFVPLEHRVLS